MDKATISFPMTGYDDGIFILLLQFDVSGWPHLSQDKIPCVFPEFSLCYEFFPCVFFHKINRWF